jgi:DNA helicase-2/ATP-dependent DNA helicase PcrA
VRAVTHWRSLVDTMTHTELSELILDESGYTAMWQADKSPEAPGKLENLKELVRSMEEFETLTGYLEHISLVMEAATNDNEDKVSIMTLHAAKGLEFETVFLPGWEEGLFPHQRSLDESGDKGLEEERRLAYVGITRAKIRATISFAGNRRTHGQWNSALPSRFIDELPMDHVEVAENSHDGAGLGTQSRFANDFSGSTYNSPGWQRAQSYKAAQKQKYAGATLQGRGESTPSTLSDSEHARGDRIFHQKFGYGRIQNIEGNKLSVAFEKAGTKKVLDSYVEKP